jgi:hypothetical protein
VLFSFNGKSEKNDSETYFFSLNDRLKDEKLSRNVTLDKRNDRKRKEGEGEPVLRISLKWQNRENNFLFNNLFRENCVNIQAGWTDWANFRLFGEYFRWAGFFLKIVKVSQIFMLLFPTVICSYVSILTTYVAVGLHFGRFYHKLNWSPWSIGRFATANQFFIGPLFVINSHKNS